MAATGSNHAKMVDHRANRCGVIGELRDPPHFFPFMRPETPLGAGTRLRLDVTLGLWCVAFAALLALFVPMLGPVAGAIGPVPGWVFVVAVVAFASSVIGFLVARGVSRSHWKAAGRTDAATLLAARGRCPACGGWLLSAPPDADRRTTCPSCAAAWTVGNTEGCPGCGYDMARVPASAGPLAICPECATLSAASARGEAPRPPDPQRAPPD